MESQQTEMIRLRGAAARKKEAAARVQALLLKQIGTHYKSQPFPTARRNV